LEPALPRYPETTRQQILTETRRRLLEAAVVEIAREGFSGANIDRVSRVAGLGKGTVYNHFPGKRALMLALIDEVGRQHREFIEQRVLRESAPAARLRAFFLAGFAFVEEHLPEARLALSTLNGADAEFHARLYAAYLPIFEFVAAQIIQPGISAGVFHECQPIATASLLMTLYLGSASSIDPSGKHFMNPELVADFALAALKNHPEAT
jgi:AcrR family transcriptional regulator